MRFDQPPVVRVRVDPDDPPPGRDWPMMIPAVAQLAREGLDLPPGVTFLVGENGSGKSTIVEAVATAYGLSPEGGPDGRSGCSAGSGRRGRRSGAVRHPLSGRGGDAGRHDPRGR